MSTFFQTFVRAAPFSWIAAAGMGVALASCLATLLLRARLATPQRWVAFPILCALALLTAAVVAIGGVEIGRHDVAGQLGGREAFVKVASDVVSRGIARQLTGLVLLGPIVLVSLASAGLLRWVLPKRPAVSPSRAAVVLGMTVVLPLIIGALAASVYGLWLHAGWIGIADVEPSDKERVMLQRLQQADHLLTLLRASIVASAGAGLIAAIVGARSAGARPLGRARVAMATAIFAAGLGAFASTRGQAGDRPLPILTDNQRNSLGIVMPRFSRCRPRSTPASVLEFSANDVTFDRKQVSPEDFRDKLVTYRDLFPLFFYPKKPPVPPTLLVLADVATPIDSMLPYLFYAGDIEILMVGSNPRPFTSTTLGILGRREFCYGAFSLRDDGVPLSRYRTWRDLVLAVDRSATILRIAAR